MYDVILSVVKNLTSYFYAFQKVAAGNELLVWYGDEYGKELGGLRVDLDFLQPKNKTGNL